MIYFRKIVVFEGREQITAAIPTAALIAFKYFMPPIITSIHITPPRANLVYAAALRRNNLDLLHKTGERDGKLEGIKALET